MLISPSLHHAWRSVRRSPGFALTASALLSVGIAANGFLFSAVAALFIKSTPGVRDAAEIHWIEPSTTERVAFGLSLDDLRAIEASPLAGRVSAFVESPVAVTVAGRPARRAAQLVSREYFALLGVSAARGRLFLEDETAPGASAPVVVVSHRLGIEEFGAIDNAVGQQMRVGGAAVTVVGVVAPEFNGAGGFDRRDLWLPLASASLIPGALGERSLVGVARLRPADNHTALTEALRAIIGVGYEREHVGRSAVVRLAPARAGFSSDERSSGLPAVVIGGLLGLTLLILTFANVGNLLLARGIARHHQLSVLAALGASRRALALQLAIEGLICSLAGAAVGVAAVAIAVRLVNARGVALQLTVDGRIVAFSIALALITGALVSLAPALRSTRNLASSIRGGTTATVPGRLRLQTAFVSIQLAASFAALAVAGIFVAALRRTIDVPSGYASADRVAVVSYDPALLRYSPDRARALRERIVREVEALPDVERVAYADILPLGGRNVAQGWKLAGGSDRADLTTWNAHVSPEYFGALGIRIAKGRGFGHADFGGEERTAVVNEEFARRVFRAGDAVGRHFWRDDGTGPIQIVGVASVAKYHTMMETPRPFVYLPYRTGAARAGNLGELGELTVFARTRRADAETMRSIEAAVRGVDPDLPLLRVSFLYAIIAARNGPVRLTAAILASMGVLAVLIAVAGVFAVGSYLGSARSRELAIRSALGARRAQLVGFMLRQGLAILAAGIIGGLALAALSLQALRGMVGELGQANVLVLLTASLVLGTSALVALLVPALKASRVDPIETMKST